MKNRYIEFYLFLTPFISCFGIVLSALRISEGQSFILAFLLISLILDLFLVFIYSKSIINKDVVLCFLLLIPPLLVGFVNHELSRRHFSDFLMPILFFMKVALFSNYWGRADIMKFIKFYSRVTLVLSFILLLFVYYIFSVSGATRLSIYPPLELSTSYYLMANPLLFAFSFCLIVAYGKRAQLISAIVIFAISYKFVNSKMKLIFTLSAFTLIVAVVAFISHNPDNLSIRRLVYSFELLSSGDLDSLTRLSAGRFDEVITILKDMQWIDFLYGKGNGYTYELMLLSGEMKEVTNAHFTPLGLLSKYGVFFTIFMYHFFYKKLSGFSVKASSVSEKIVYISVLFLFLESFFSYSLYVVSITPILIGSLISFQKIR